jgi:integration host factor subunit alpha
MALTKADMAESLFNELGLNKREARELVDLYFEELRASLAVGEQIKLSGFGNFDLHFQAGTKTKSPSRGLCWNRGITTNYLQFLANAISPSVK